MVLRRSQTNYSKSSGSKQRYSLPPPPSYTSHLAATNTFEHRKEFALSGHDWTQRNSDIFNDYETGSRPTSEYDSSDCWRGKGKFENQLSRDLIYFFVNLDKLFQGDKIEFFFLHLTIFQSGISLLIIKKG